MSQENKRRNIRLFGRNLQLRPAERGLVVVLAVVLLFRSITLCCLPGAECGAASVSIQPDSVVYADAEILVKADEVTDSIPLRKSQRMTIHMGLTAR